MPRIRGPLLGRLDDLDDPGIFLAEYQLMAAAETDGCHRHKQERPYRLPP